MKSKVLSLILAVCTLCSLLVSPASAVGGDSAVQMVQALGILDGTDLESPVTRAEFSKMLVQPPPIRIASAARAADIPCSGM